MKSRKYKNRKKENWILLVLLVFDSFLWARWDCCFYYFLFLFLFALVLFLVLWKSNQAHAHREVGERVEVWWGKWEKKIEFSLRDRWLDSLHSSSLGRLSLLLLCFRSCFTCWFFCVCGNLCKKGIIQLHGFLSRRWVLLWMRVSASSYYITLWALQIAANISILDVSLLFLI